jgi:glycosyltransferase involved in cell wall biosynthesis
MRHLFVFLELFAREGGIQSYVKDVLQAYGQGAKRDDYRGTVALLHDRPPSVNPLVSDRLSFTYLHHRSSLIQRLRLAFYLLRICLLSRPERVICGHVKLAPLVQLVCKPLGIPYTVMTYGKEVWGVWEHLSPWEINALRGAATIWTISRHSRDRLCASHNIPHSQVDFLPCVVDETQFTPGPKPQHLLDRYGLQGAKVLMTVARLWPEDIYKGVDVMIQALPEIAAAIPTVKYLVIGRGGDQPRLAQLAAALGVSDRVIFAGFVPTAELPDHYRVADAYAMPSQEGFGIVYLEAMVTGIPVLSGLGDGSADPLQDGRVGWQVEHRNVKAIAQGCIAMLQGDDPRCRGDWLRSEAIAKFGKSQLAQRLQDLLT